jgi:hypothetical protein
VGQAWLTKDREEAGYFNSSSFEKAEQTDLDALKLFLVAEMKNSGVVCVLVGTETAYRPWVRYEILRGLWDERGLLAVQIHGIAGWDRRTTAAGPNPFDLLGIFITEAVGTKSIRFLERENSASKWSYASDFSKPLSQNGHTAVFLL